MKENLLRRLKMIGAFIAATFLWELGPVVAWIGRKLGIGRDRQPPS
jgi:hypothetical protein